MARKSIAKLVWRGPQVVQEVLQAVSDGYTEFGLLVETNAKAELKKGHGVRTGTLRRSIHLAKPGYPWSADNVESAPGTPELGRKKVAPEISLRKISLQVGSGLVYALTIHQGYGPFGGYHYLTLGLQKAKPQLKAILEKHKGKKRL